MYSAEIKRDSPGCLVIMIDQSGSMSKAWDVAGVAKSSVLADTVNALISEAVFRSTIGETVRNYFRVGILGYSGKGVYDALSPHDSFDKFALRSISELASSPRRIDHRLEQVETGAGEYDDASVAWPIWLEPRATGTTPMVAAFEVAHKVIQEWTANNRASYPPIVINVMDAWTTDGDPVDAAGRLRGVSTDDGETLLFNVHIAATSDPVTVFPASREEAGGDSFVQKLFAVSSILPPPLLSAAASQNIHVRQGSRGFARGVDPGTLVSILDVGSRPLLQSVS